MLAFQAGDPTAFEELFARHRTRAFNFFLRGVGRPADAEDLTQETFLRVYRARGSYQPKARFTTWMYHIAANLMFNLFRDVSRRAAVSLDGPGLDGEAPPEPAETRAAGPEEEAERGEAAGTMREAVRGLPERQRTALLLVEVERMSYAEVADALGVSVASVESLLFRARDGLRHSLGAVRA